MAEPTLYLFDGYNLLHAGEFKERDELIDALASFVASRGVRGVVVFDGVGEDRVLGPLAIRYSAHADDVIERLAAESRSEESVCVVTSDALVRRTSGQEVRQLASSSFLADLEPVTHTERDQTGAGGRVGDRLDPETRERLERLRRGL